MDIYKWDYIKMQLAEIAEGLFEHYGGLPKHSIGSQIFIVSDISANNKILLVGARSTLTMPEYELSLAIRESGEANFSVSRTNPFKSWPTYDIPPGGSIDRIISDIISEK